MATLLACFTITHLFLSSLSFIQASNGGFSIELIHRDSPKSPFYNPLDSPYQRVNKALQRSINRVHLLDSSFSSQEPQSEVYTNRGEYLMKVSLGTPPFEILGIADTGSDLTWTQCEPCNNCYRQVAPLFDPSSSTTYKNIACQSKVCESLPQSSCDGNEQNDACIYQYSYGDRSHTNGNLGLETITLGSTNGRPFSFTKFVFGCGHDNAGSFNEKDAGIVGLGGGPISLVSQMSSSIDGKFSYCLVQPISSSSGNTSTLSFGSNAVLRGSGVQSTPLVQKDPSTYYHLTLESFSVGSKKITYGDSTSEGNIIIDSGTTLTLLPQDVFSELSDAVDQAVGGTRVEDPSGLLSLCYGSDSIKSVPTITAHFSGGADVELDPAGTFIAVADHVVCFAFRPADSLAIFGNLAQVNYKVAYDLTGKTVSFEKADCTKA